MGAVALGEFEGNLAHDAGPRRLEVFALFNVFVFYQTGILLGPLLGLARTGIDFRLTRFRGDAVAFDRSGWSYDIAHQR